MEYKFLGIKSIAYCSNCPINKSSLCRKRRSAEIATSPRFVYKAVHCLVNSLSLQVPFGRARARLDSRVPHRLQPLAPRVPAEVLRAAATAAAPNTHSEAAL